MQPSKRPPRIIVIQFRKNLLSIEQERQCFVREAGIYTEIDFIDALDTTIDFTYPETIMEGYSGVILGGSGDLDFDGGRTADDPVRHISYEILGRLRPLFSYLFEHDIPTLGICYGHQILGAFAGAQVRHDINQSKRCSHEVKMVVDKNDYFLFSDLPDSFLAMYGHKDVLDRVPDGAMLLMSGGERCQVSALRYKQNIFSTQFHPELNLEDMKERSKQAPEFIPTEQLFEELFAETPYANGILQNFSKYVAVHNESSTSKSDSV